MTRAIRKKSGTGVKTNWHFVWSCSEIDKMITRTDPMIDGTFCRSALPLAIARTTFPFL